MPQPLSRLRMIGLGFAFALIAETLLWIVLKSLNLSKSPFINIMQIAAGVAAFTAGAAIEIVTHNRAVKYFISGLAQK